MKRKFPRKLIRASCCTLVVVALLCYPRQEVERPVDGISHVRPKVIFGVNTIESKRDLLSALLQTWGMNETILATDCLDSTHHPSVQRIESNPCSEYPPVLSWITTLREMSRVHSDWYFKADDDTYVHIKRLHRLVVDLEASGYSPDVFVYLGGFAPGREHEREKLGLAGRAFVMGGPGILLSRRAMQQLAPILEECMTSPVESMHSDTQLARCLYSLSPNYTVKNKDIIAKYSKCFKAYYQKDGIKETKPFDYSTVPRTLRVRDQSYVSLHSLKNAEDMFAAHEQVMKSGSYGETPWCPI